MAENMQRGQRAHRTSCDDCKRKKIRCDRQDDLKCSRCISRNIECTVTLLERKRRQQLKKLDPISSLENRMKQLEAAINASGLDVDSPTELSLSRDIESRAALSDKLSTLVISEDGTSQFVGPSSGFSLFSRVGLNWITRKTGNDDFARFVLDLHKDLCRFHDLGLEIWHTLSDSEREPFPPKDIADSYLNCFFRVFNWIFPLYDKTDFMARYSRQPTPKPSEDLPWYASVNVVLAIGAFISCDKRLAACDGEVRRTSRKYLRNACSTLSSLIFNDANLLAVQALAGIAFMLQASSESQMFYMATAAAARLAHSMGLHRRLQNVGFSDAEVEQRRNVFWVVYVLEKGSSSHLGRSSAMHDDDIAVEIPTPKTLPCFPDGSKQYDTFPSWVKLHIISSRVYSDLYCAKAQTKTSLERQRLAKALEKQFDEWRDSLPVELRPGQPIRCHGEMFIRVMMLHLSYYASLMSFYHIPAQHLSQIDDDDENVMAGQESQTIRPVSSSIDVARRVIRLLQEHREQYLAAVRIVRISDCSSISALMALFANILQNPRDSNALSDLQLMCDSIKIITRAIECIGDAKVMHCSKLFEKMTHVAVHFVKQALAEDVQSAKQLSQSSSGSSGQTPATDEGESPASVMTTTLSISSANPADLGEPMEGEIPARTQAAQPDTSHNPFNDLSPETLMPTWSSDPSMPAAIGPSYANYQFLASNNDGVAHGLPLTNLSTPFEYAPSSFAQSPGEDNFMMDVGGTSSFPMVLPWNVADLFMRESGHETKYP